jgi:hypothetical protein
VRPPLEYGDNFPVPTGSWNPTVPWRFPNTEIRPRRFSMLKIVLPWLTLGLGVTLGILWMSWRTGEGTALEAPVPVPASGAPAPVQSAPVRRPPPVQIGSELA